MRIAQILLEGYGKFAQHTLELPFAQRDIHLIVGANEAGKSTIRSSISDWLYGVPVRSPQTFKFSAKHLKLSGRLERKNITGAIEGLSFIRSKGNKNTLRNLDESPLEDFVLSEWLHRLERSEFEKAWSLTHDILREGGNSMLQASDDLGSTLFQAASGVSRINEILKQLQLESDSQWASRKANERAYYKALDAYDNAKQELSKMSLRAADWTAQREELQGLSENLSEAMLEQGRLNQIKSLLDRVRRTAPIIHAIDIAKQGLEELRVGGEVPLLPVDAEQVLNTVRQEESKTEALVSRFTLELRTLECEANELVPDFKLLAAEEDIEKARAACARTEDHPVAIETMRNEISAEENHLCKIAQSLDWSFHTLGDVATRLPASNKIQVLKRLISDLADKEKAVRLAEQTLQARRESIAKLEKTLATVDVTTSISLDLKAAYQNATRMGEPEVAVANLTTDMAGLDRKISEAFKALSDSHQSEELLHKVLPPERGVIAGLQKKIEGALRNISEGARTLENSQADTEQLRIDLKHLVKVHQLVSYDDMMHARQERDRQWSEIKASPDRIFDRSSNFENLTMYADELADKRLDKAQFEADRLEKMRQLAQSEQHCSYMQNQLNLFRSELADLEKQWIKLCEATRLPFMPIESTEQWLNHRVDVLKLIADRNTLKEQQSKLSGEIESSRLELWRLLTSKEERDDTPKWRSCVQRAANRISQVEQALGHKRSLTEQLSDEKILAESEVFHLEKCEKEFNTCMKLWAVSLTSAGFATTTSVIQVEADLNLIEEMATGFDKLIHTSEKKLKELEVELTSRDARVSKLCEQIATDLSDTDSQSAVRILAERLDNAKRQRDLFKENQRQITKLKAELKDAVENQDNAAALLKPIYSVAGVINETECRMAIFRSNAYRRYDADLQKAMSDLVASSDGKTEVALRSELAGQDLSTLSERIIQLSSDIRSCDEKVVSLSGLHGSKRERFERLSEGSSAASAEAKRHEAIAAMADAVERYFRLNTALKLLRHEVERFRQTSQGPMLSRASGHFKKLTSNSFERLDVDSENNVLKLVGLRPSETQFVPISGMSEGTCDQLYLALRIAALEGQLETGVSLPMIADDIFINFDDIRTKAGFQVLGELSEQTQVIFFTHHHNHVELAREVLGKNVNVVELI